MDIPNPWLLKMKEEWILARDAALAEDPPRELSKEDWAMEVLILSLVPFMAKMIYDQIASQL